MASSAQWSRKRPVVVEAIQYTGQNDFEIISFAGRHVDFVRSPAARAGLALPHFRIATLEGTMELHAGEWLIRGVEGEFYPCKPNIFEATY